MATRGSLEITTTELTLAKIGGLVPATDGRTHRLTITVTEGRNGWQNVVVSSTTDWGKPMEYGFLPSAYSDTGKPRWSYNRRPPQVIVDARKAIVKAVQAPATAAEPTAPTRTAEEITAARQAEAERIERERSASAAELAEAKRVIATYEACDQRIERARKDAEAQYVYELDQRGYLVLRETPDYAAVRAAVEPIAREERARQAAIGFNAYYRAQQIRNAYSRAVAQAQVDHAEHIAYGDGR